MEYEFRQEIMNRLFDMAYKKMSQYNKDLNQVDIPEIAKLEEDRLDCQINVWITGLVTTGRLYEAYNEYILQVN